MGIKDGTPAPSKAESCGCTAVTGGNEVVSKGRQVGVYIASPGNIHWIRHWLVGLIERNALHRTLNVFPSKIANNTESKIVGDVWHNCHIV
jgi:hypothetical protein